MPNRAPARRITAAARGVLVLAALAALAAPAAPSAGQGTADSITLAGTVVRQTRAGGAPVARTQVVLHRVNAADAGPVDSMRTDARGAYTFRVRPDSSSLYLVSAQHGGIAYFSPPAGRDDSPAPAEISVFDTTSRDIPLRVMGRHLIVSAPDANGVRGVVDVAELQNDDILTRVAGVEGRPTFSTLLPDGATNARVPQGDVSSGGVTIREGRADVYAAFSPGIRQLVLAYDLPASAFPLALPIDRPTGLLEVLLEETDGRATWNGVKAEGVVEVDGRRFARFTGQDVVANAVLSIVVAGGSGMEGVAGALPPWVIPALLSLFTLGALWAFARRRAPAAAAGIPAAAPGSAPSAEALARAAAAVDALLASAEQLPEGARAALADYRASLKAQLVARLAARTPGR